jgi:PAS domain S-box-containing protein
MNIASVMGWLTKFRSRDHAIPAPRPKTSPLSPRTVQLYETSQRFTALVEHSPLAVIEWNPEHRITKWMGNAEALFGWRPSEVLGKRVEEFGFIHPEDIGIVQAAFHDLKHGKSSVVRNRNYRKDGAVVYCEWYNSAMIQTPGEFAWGLSLALDVTQRHEMEEVLRANEKRLVSIYNAVDDVIMHLAVEPEGQFRILSVNAAFARITGLSVEATNGKRLSEVVPEPSLTRASAKFRQVVEEKTIVRWEETSEYAIGHVTAEVTAAPILANDGKCSHVVVSAHDITDRLQAQEALRASEKQFRNLFDSAPVGIFQSTVSGRFLSANPRCASMFGYDSAEELIRSVTDVTSQNYIEGNQRREVLRKISEANGSYIRAEVNYQRKDGTPFICNLYMRALTPDAPDPILEGFNEDITERKHAQRALHESEQRFRNIVEAAPVGIFQTTSHCQMISANPRLAIMFGYDSPEELLRAASHSHADDLYVDPCQHTDIVRRVKEARGDYVQAEVTYRRKDGSPFVCNLYMRVVNPDDPDSSLEGFNEDITERKHAEEALGEAHLVLERRVEERTAELSSANEALKELDRLKSQFLASMSHELRTPLNSIIGFTSLLRRGISGPVNDEQAKQLGIVQTSASHLLGLINDLLDVSRVEAGKADLHCEHFDFVEVANEVVRAMQPLAEKNGVTVVLAVQAATIPMHGDRKRTLQILLNLVSNAVKFTAKGSVTITATASMNRVRVEVADTGIGIKPEHVGMLFEAFRQVDGSAKRVYEGTGLGLYLCRKLLSIMGGEISVESEYGKGSRFMFSLPLALGDYGAATQSIAR